MSMRTHKQSTTKIQKHAIIMLIMIMKIKNTDDDDDDDDDDDNNNICKKKVAIYSYKLRMCMPTSSL